MKQRFVLTWVMILSLLTLAFPLPGSHANARAAAISSCIHGMQVAAPAKASWRVVKRLNPGGFSSYLYGVAAVSATDVWAVGPSCTLNGESCKTLIEHWDGTSWRVVPSPSPGSGGSDLLI